MKFVKSISLFFILPLALMGMGFCIGIYFSHNNNILNDLNKVKYHNEQEKLTNFRKTSSNGEQIIDADTHFMVEEADLRRDTFVETEWELPDKYIGMNREEFIEAMDEYELTPPLSELERGFVSLEVKSFSDELVVVRMNYSYIMPSKSFYIMAQKHQIVVYCDDKRTLYMKTNIMLDTLPENLQQEIINGMFVADEKTLYYFLESYSS